MSAQLWRDFKSGVFLGSDHNILKTAGLIQTSVLQFQDNYSQLTESFSRLSSLDCKEIQPVHPKGDQSWVFTGRTDAEAETPVLWPPDAKS